MKTVNLALQGGGAHGAFGWGVLDQLCADGRLAIDGLSATSAGSMNAAVYAYARDRGDSDFIRQSLEDFWRDISRAGQWMSPVRSLPAPFGQQLLESSFRLFDSFTRVFSPYQFNPANLNPLRDVLNRHVDFEALHHCRTTQLFIAATNVRSNRIKIFKNHDVCIDAVLASACLPMLFQAVEIDGEAYWDGGYMGNPALYPLIYETPTDEIIILHINPIERDEVPKSAEDIANRINELSFNSSLMRELRAISFAKRLVENDWIKPEYRDQFQFNELHLHSIRADEVMRSYSLASKFDTNWENLCALRDAGRETAAAWLDQNYEHIGVKSTLDLEDFK